MIRRYEQPLDILRFDHRETFETKMFGWQGRLTPAQTAEIASAKQVISEGFQRAMSTGVPKANPGILAVKRPQSFGYLCVVTRGKASCKSG